MKVTNEECDALPPAAFTGEIDLIDNADKVQAAVEEMRTYKLLGFDTETRPNFVRGANYGTALLQLSTERKTWLVRLCHTGMTQELADLMADNDICKVGLAILDDLRGLQRLRKFKPANCIDLQKMARERGIEELGLKKMAAQVLGVKVSKRQRLTNWEATVLTEAQLTYAATDSWISLLIYKEYLKGVTIHPRLLALRNSAQP